MRFSKWISRYFKNDNQKEPIIMDKKNKISQGTSLEEITDNTDNLLTFGSIGGGKCTRVYSPLLDVMTAAEAAEIWRVGLATIKHACSGQHGKPPRFMNCECRKSKGTWLVTKAGMERLYGKLEWPTKREDK